MARERHGFLKSSLILLLLTCACIAKLQASEVAKPTDIFQFTAYAKQLRSNADKDPSQEELRIRTDYRSILQHIPRYETRELEKGVAALIFDALELPADAFRIVDSKETNESGLSRTSLFHLRSGKCPAVCCQSLSQAGAHSKWLPGGTLGHVADQRAPTLEGLFSHAHRAWHVPAGAECLWTSAGNSCAWPKNG